jgi:hypothetical protein
VRSNREVRSDILQTSRSDGDEIGGYRKLESGLASEAADNAR